MSTKVGRLQVRINQIDYALIPPGDLDNSSLPQVPVLRIFGPSSTGQTACIHIHQVYPYFYIEYFGKVSPRHVNQYIAKLYRSLNHAMALSLKKNPDSRKSQFIRAIVLVKGVHFYGFHASYKPFLKILAANPSHISRIAAILQSGSVMGMRFTVFESHLSYVLQFLCDFDLYGCGLIDLEDALERGAEDPGGDQEPLSSTETNAVKFGISSYFRESRLQLELDVIAPHILNRHRLTPRHLHHQLEIPAPVLPPEPLILSVRELWDDERRRRQALGLDPSPEIPIDPSESSRSGGGEWVAEARWWNEIRNRIERERNSVPPEEKDEEWHRSVMTTFESVEAIWEKQYKKWKPAKKQGALPQESTKSDQNPPPLEYSWDVKTNADIDLKDDQIDVDISMFSNEDIGELEQEEEKWGREAFDEVPVGEDIVDDDEDTTNEDTANEDELHLSDSPIAVVDGMEERTPSPLDPFLESTDDQRQPFEYRLQSPPAFRHIETQSRERSLSPTQLIDIDRQAVNLGDLDTRLHFDVEEMRPGCQPEENVITTPDVRISRSTQPTVGFVSEAAFEALVSPADCDTLDNRQELAVNSQLQVDETILASTNDSSAKDRISLITARAVKLSKVFNSFKATNSNRYVYAVSPPTSLELKHSLETLGLASKIYQNAHYSRDEDIPELSKEYAGLTYRLKGGQGIATLEEWLSSESNAITSHAGSSLQLDSAGIGGWEYASHPPSAREVRQSMATIDAESIRARLKEKFRSQIEGPTQANIYGFKTSPVVAGYDSRESANMSILSMEIFVPTVDMKVPNPESDAITAIFYAHLTRADVLHTGILVLENSPLDQRRQRPSYIEVFKTEIDLLNKMIDLGIELDPDVLTGWEVQNNSWGYVEARGAKLGLSVSELISRAPPRYSIQVKDQWAFRKTSHFKVTGRHVLNLWRIMRSERNLTIYTFENVVFDVLRRRVPSYSYKTLTNWYRSDTPAHQRYLLEHISMRALTNLQLLEETEMVTKTAEFARVFGVDFFSVISRGSQFKVESFMFRLAKPESFVLIAPSRGDVGKQNAAECMPLIMEPESSFYSSPVLVLDFQSLYPSIMIAYNYCYSTCLGRITDFQGKNKFGVIDDFDIPSDLLAKLQDHLTVAPNGIMYVKSHVRKGLLGRMLVELLETRVMVKQAMKRVGDDKARTKILNARQLSLKYIANVTYGYAGATFSGRMPAVEIADSIVQSGRETLEKAIDVIEGTKKWGAKVVYGDTDSVFAYLPGKTKEEAFAIGYDIASTITAMNPSPIKLKFEKVYLPCVLMAKKRYVGFKYENIDDVEPIFDAKGIETVRRDGVLAQRKMVENCLKILFRTQDLSEVKDYCCRSWTKLFENRASVHDFIFAKEVKMGTYSDKGPPPPGAMIAAQRMVIDPHNEPQYSDRIPYVIVQSGTGAKLVDRAMDPLNFMNNSQFRLDAVYYITRVLIPPLERIFNLVGADVRQWYNEMPKTLVAEPVSPKKPKVAPMASNPDIININEHFSSTQCLSCREPASQTLCDTCCFLTQETIANLHARIRTREERLMNVHRICTSCTGCAPSEPIHCESIDCQWFYARRKAETGLELVPLFADLAEELEDLNDDEDGGENEDGDGSDTLLYDIEDSSQYVPYIVVDDDEKDC